MHDYLADYTPASRAKVHWDIFFPFSIFCLCRLNDNYPRLTQNIIPYIPDWPGILAAK